jgi:peptide/nickel transport system permease protein
MTRYLVRRITALIALMAAVLVVTFGVFFLIPSNPALRSCGRYCSPEKLLSIEHKLGLDKSVPAQFGSYVAGLFVGRDYGDGTQVDHCPAPCLGYSFKTDEPVLGLIVDRFPVTFSIAIGAAVLWVLFGVSTGLVSALKAGGNVDKTIVGVATTSLSLPVQLVGAALLVVFSAKLGAPFPHYVNFADDPVGWATNLIFPWVTLAFIYSAVYTRLTRTQMVEAMQEDYIRTARGKGLPERRVAGRHGLRAALPPLIVVFGLDLGALLGGAIITERIFGMPGLGNLAIQSILDLNLPVLLGVTLFGAFFVLMANLVVDVIYGLSDPKVTLK